MLDKTSSVVVHTNVVVFETLLDVCNYRSVKSDVMSNFRHVEDLLNLAGEGFVCLLACKVLGIANVGK